MTARHRSTSVLVALLATVWLLASWGNGGRKRTSAPRSRPATRPAEPASRPVDVVDRLAERVAELVERFRLADFRQRRAAEEELLALHRAYVDALTRHADDNDPEVRARVLDALGRIIAVTRFERVLAKLPPSQRTKLLRLKKTHPQIVTDMFSLTWTRRLGAIKKIEALDDDDGLAEPLVVLCINHPSEALSVAAIEAVAANGYRSDATVDALVKVLRLSPAEVSDMGWRPYTTAPRPHLAALDALKAIASKRAAPALLSLLVRTRQHDVQWRTALAEALGATGERRAIPLLIKELSDTSIRSTWSMNNVKITMAPSDGPLLALIRLTAQSVPSYGFVSQMHHWEEQREIVGFPNKEARAKAVKKFKGWWADHKGKPPYRDLKPLVLPESGGENRSPAPAERTVVPRFGGAAPVHPGG